MEDDSSTLMEISPSGMVIEAVEQPEAAQRRVTQIMWDCESLHLSLITETRESTQTLRESGSLAGGQP